MDIEKYKQLLAEKEALEAKLSEVRANEVASVIEQIRQLMADYDLTVDDIAPKRRRGRPAAAGVAHKSASALPPNTSPGSSSGSTGSIRAVPAPRGGRGLASPS